MVWQAEHLILYFREYWGVASALAAVRATRPNPRATLVSIVSFRIADSPFLNDRTAVLGRSLDSRNPHESQYKRVGYVLRKRRGYERGGGASGWSNKRMGRSTTVSLASARTSCGVAEGAAVKMPCAN